MHGNALINFKETIAKNWSKKVNWINLRILKSIISNNTGYVEFEAHFVDNYRLKSIHEKSEFIYEDGLWYYINGTHFRTNQTEKIISRNTICPCGSKSKFKNCHEISKNYPLE